MVGQRVVFDHINPSPADDAGRIVFTGINNSQLEDVYSSDEGIGVGSMFRALKRLSRPDSPLTGFHSPNVLYRVNRSHIVENAPKSGAHQCQGDNTVV